MKCLKKSLLLSLLFFVSFVGLHSLGATLPEIPTALPLEPSEALLVPSWVEVILEESETSKPIALMLPEMLSWFETLSSEQKTSYQTLVKLQADLVTLQISSTTELEKAGQSLIEFENKYKRIKWERDILIGATGGLILTGVILVIIYS